MRIVIKRKYLLLCIALMVFVIIITISLLYALTPKPVDDSYFISDESKDVITLEVDKANSATTDLLRTHIVYIYENDRVKSLKTYYEYENNELASQALENIKEINKNAVDVYLDGKYIVVVSAEKQYENLNPSDIKQQAEAIKTYQDNKTEEKTP